MKLYRLLLISATIILMAGCAKEFVGENPNNSEQNVAENDVLQGWVRIKLADDSTPLSTGVFTRGADISEDQDLNNLAADLGVTEIRRLFTPNKRFEARHRKYGLHLWFEVKIDDQVSVTRAQNAFASLPNISIAEPIRKIYPTGGPGYLTPSDIDAQQTRAYGGNQRTMPFNDPGLKFQWHYDNDGSVPNSVAGADMALFKAWENLGTAGDPSIIIQLADAGFDYDHEDLKENIWVNEAELNGQPGVDDDYNGCVDDIHGWNFHKSSAAIDKGSHATHVAGTMVAVNGNGKGVCGVAGGTGKRDGAKVIITQIIEETYDANYPNVDQPDAYVYAADHGAVISQNSWNYSTMDNVLGEALSVAFDYFIDNAGTDENGNQIGPMKGGVIIFSAGNDSATRITLPAADPRLIAVTSMLPNYVKARYSNFGIAADICAPGGNGHGDELFVDNKSAGVYSTMIDNSYGYMSGTSMAAPHVSGVAALIISKFGGVGKQFTNVQLKNILLKSYRNIGEYQTLPSHASGLGVGLLDASMISISNPNTPPEIPGDLTLKKGNEKELIFTFTVPLDGNTTLTDDQRAVAKFVVSYAKKTELPAQLAWETKTITNVYPVGKVISYTITGLEDATEYVVKVKSIDRFGNESEFSATQSQTTVDHVNHPPTSKTFIPPVSIAAGPSNATEIDLSKYFTDPDLPNDKLTYSCTIVHSDIATASIVNETTLKVEGVKKGSTSVVVKVTDLAGASIESTFTVEITTSVGNTSPEFTKEFKPVSLPGADNSFKTKVTLSDYFTDEDQASRELSYSAVSSNLSVVSVTVAGNILEITALGKGEANITVVATDHAGATAEGIMNVKVTADPVSPVVGKISIAQNPVGDELTILLKTNSTTPSKLTVYDSASRPLIESYVTFVNDQAKFNVSELSAGMYSFVVEVSNLKYRMNFIKK